MGTVGQTYKNSALRVSIRGGLVLLATAALASGCARPAATDVPRQRPLQAPPAPAAELQADKTLIRAARLRAEQTRGALARRWGLKRVPLTAPPAPVTKPRITTRDGFEVDGHEEKGLPPVFTTIPTDQKIVFLTVDDGAEKDPAFLRMTSELRIPYTAFLSDYLIKDDYGYFRKMRDRGVALDNHTLHHPYLPGLSYARQKREICGMQDVIEKQYGKRPALFRPPYGNYNEDTLRAARSCGIRYAPIWNEEVFADHWEYREWDRRIRPGDIVLSHFRGRADGKGTMTDMVRRFLDKVTAEGYAVARLEDYL
ncbi:polysaccharide deacetylase family protein [Streptomyces sp. SAI-208]|uniref:polysaccharide deacetylase family protein n=1 Tax=Streptomyces sp. SAI-208 TaxID=2940550 RepID=UPI002476CE4F|nr:polysaccharide deacetylase family protein [Streptomyces sp. SAI-208]